MSRVDNLIGEIEDVFDEYDEVGDEFDEDDLRDIIATLRSATSALIEYVR